MHKMYENAMKRKYKKKRKLGVRVKHRTRKKKWKIYSLTGNLFETIIRKNFLTRFHIFHQFSG